MSTRPITLGPDMEPSFTEDFKQKIWVLVDVTKLTAVGTFKDLEKARTVRRAQFPECAIVELKDVEDALFERGAHS